MSTLQAGWGVHAPPVSQEDVKAFGLCVSRDPMSCLSVLKSESLGALEPFLQGG